MGAKFSAIIFQPLLLGTAIALMVAALVYKGKASDCGKKEEWGREVFKLEMGIAITILITAILIGFFSSLSL